MQRKPPRGPPSVVRHAVVLIVIEPPEARQRAEGDVELAAGPLADLRARLAGRPDRRLTAAPACSPAAALSRSMSLPGFQTLISASSRSNSAKTASAAERAAVWSADPDRQPQFRSHRDPAHSRPPASRAAVPLTNPEQAIAAAREEWLPRTQQQRRTSTRIFAQKDCRIRFQARSSPGSSAPRGRPVRPSRRESPAMESTVWMPSTR